MKHERSHGFRDAESGVAPPAATVRRPVGADVLKHERSHGFRDAESGVAPPVATFLRPVGAKCALTTSASRSEAVPPWAGRTRAQTSPRRASGKWGPNGHYFYRIRPCRFPPSPGGASERRSVAPAGLRTRQKKKRICTCVAMFPGLAAGARAQSARRAFTRSDGPVVLRPVPPAASSAASALDASVFRLRRAVSHPHYLRESAQSLAGHSLRRRRLRMIRCCLSVQSTIHNPPSPRLRRTSPQSTRREATEYRSTAKIPYRIWYSDGL